MNSFESREKALSVGGPAQTVEGMKYVSGCGVVETVAGADFFVSNPNSRGFAVYGPYLELEAGLYLVTFDLELHDYKGHYSDQVCATFDVVTDNGNTKLEQTNIYESRLKTPSPSCELLFKLDRTSAVEFRFQVTGRSRLRIKMAPRLRKLNSDRQYFVPMLPFDAEISSPFFVKNSGHLRGMYENGASLSIDGDKTMVTFGGVSFEMNTLEDFQVVNEVFIYNDYRYLTNRRTLCVDIGMNAGLTSLLFASLPNVVEVHSYEPFSAPFLRAQKNFNHNPALQGKIFANRFGLGDGDQSLEVLTDSSQTIGTSISGLTSGVPEDIEIRDASAEIGKLAARAAELDCEVLLKVDCEGSEFPIFESLARNDLLKSVRAMAIEWHRTWAYDRNQDDLVNALLTNGFVVFDRTNASDLFAGQFVAVRVDNAKAPALLASGA